MNEGKISVRYAKAYVGYASENNILHEALKDMKFLLEASNVADFRKFLNSPSISNLEKKEVFYQLFHEIFQPETFKFIDLVLKNNRESFIPLITRKFIDEYKIMNNIKSASLQTVNPMSEKQKNILVAEAKNIFNSEIELKEEIDERIIGGFILTVEDQQFDASVSSKLKHIKEQLINATFEN